MVELSDCMQDFPGKKSADSQTGFCEDPVPCQSFEI